MKRKLQRDLAASTARRSRSRFSKQRHAHGNQGEHVERRVDAAHHGRLQIRAALVADGGNPALVQPRGRGGVQPARAGGGAGAPRS